MRQVPDRGRIVIVNFEQAGNGMPPEMDGSMRPCIVVQNNALARYGLVTVVPISTTGRSRLEESVAARALGVKPQLRVIEGGSSRDVRQPLDEGSVETQMNVASR